MTKKLFRKNIFTAASPNTQRDDIWVALKTLFRPDQWNNKKYSEKFTLNLQDYLGVKHVSLIDSGRSALNISLKALGVDEEDEVIMPSFTCLVVANAVRWTGATPIYLDTNTDDFNADYSTLPEKVSDRTKVVVVQHTFGKKVDTAGVRNELFRIGREDISIVEDFAHVIHRDIDLQGDAGFLTFGIEKVISTVRGGAVITNDQGLKKRLDRLIDELPEFPRRRVLISLLNPIFWWIAIPLHSFGIGRFTIGALIRSIWRKLGMLGIMIEKIEDRGKKPDWFPAKMSPALSKLGIKQLQKLDYYNEHRLKIAKIYSELVGDNRNDSEEKPKSSTDSNESVAVKDSSDWTRLPVRQVNPITTDDIAFDKSRVFLRFPILMQDQKDTVEVWDIARNLRITPGNWFSSPLYGATVGEDTYSYLCYVPSETPETLSKTKRVLNLPTSVNMSEKRARELVREIKKRIKI